MNLGVGKKRKMMRIGMAADHGGFELKTQLASFLKSTGCPHGEMPTQVSERAVPANTGSADEALSKPGRLTERKNFIMMNIELHDMTRRFGIGATLTLPAPR